MVRTGRTSWAPTILGGIACALAGCAGGGGHPSLEVTREASLADRSVEVDVVGVDAARLTDYTSVDVGRYFSSRSTLRSNAPKRTMKFTAGGESARTLIATDPVWKQWDGVTTLVILANIPGMTSQGAVDSRRAVVPLADAPESGVSVRVSDTGVAVDLPGLADTSKNEAGGEGPAADGL